MENWYKSSDLSDNWMITLTTNGYITDEAAFNWIYHFNLETHPTCHTDYRVLLLDNHGSHLTYDFLKFCENQRIIPFYLLPHMTHHLQPLDGIPFQQLKHWHGKAINEAVRLGDEWFDHREFLCTLPSVHHKAFTQ